MSGCLVSETLVQGSVLCFEGRLQVGPQFSFAEKRPVTLGAYEHTAVMLTRGMEAQRWAGASGHCRGAVPGWWGRALGLCWGGAERPPAQGQVSAPTKQGSSSSFPWLFLNVWGQRGLAGPLGAL